MKSSVAGLDMSLIAPAEPNRSGRLTTVSQRLQTDQSVVASVVRREPLGLSDSSMAVIYHDR